MRRERGPGRRVVPGRGGLVQGQLQAVGRERFMVRLSFISDAAIRLHPKSSLGFLGAPCLAEMWAEAPTRKALFCTVRCHHNFLNYPL